MFKEIIVQGLGEEAPEEYFVTNLIGDKEKISAHLCVDTKQYIIDNLFVPNYKRRQGIGTQLVLAAIASIQRHKQEYPQYKDFKITLVALPREDHIKQEDLFKFYSKIGFVPDLIHLEYKEG